ELLHGVRRAGGLRGGAGGDGPQHGNERDDGDAGVPFLGTGLGLAGAVPGDAADGGGQGGLPSRPRLAAVGQPAEQSRGAARGDGPVAPRPAARGARPRHAPGGGRGGGRGPDPRVGGPDPAAPARAPPLGGNAGGLLPSPPPAGGFLGRGFFAGFLEAGPGRS